MKRFILTSIGCGVGVLIAACGGRSGIPAPTYPDSVADNHAAALVAQMTIDEKIRMVHGTGMPAEPLGGPFPMGLNTLSRWRGVRVT